MKRLFTITLCLMLAACQQPGQNQYGFQDVGKATEVRFGTVVAMKQVSIKGQNTGAGALVGGLAGAGAGSYVGRGSGNVWATGGGLLAGLLVGAITEQAISDRKGEEYTITFEDGITRTIVQNIVDGDAPINTGQRVMVQIQGQYMRVLPAQDLPTSIKRPKRIKVVDDKPVAHVPACKEELRPNPDFIGPMPVDCN